jgi:hypothetical protein
MYGTEVKIQSGKTTPHVLFILPICGSVTSTAQPELELKSHDYLHRVEPVDGLSNLLPFVLVLCIC